MEKAFVTVSYQGYDPGGTVDPPRTWAVRFLAGPPFKAWADRETRRGREQSKDQNVLTIEI